MAFTDKAGPCIAFELDSTGSQRRAKFEPRQPELRPTKCNPAVPQNSDRGDAIAHLVFWTSELSSQQESQNPIGLNSGQRKERAVCRRVGPALEFVVSKNIRRHLTEEQRALVAAKLRPHFQEEARKRKLYHVETAVRSSKFREGTGNGKTSRSTLQQMVLPSWSV